MKDFNWKMFVNCVIDIANSVFTLNYGFNNLPNYSIEKWTTKEKKNEAYVTYEAKINNQIVKNYGITELMIQIRITSKGYTISLLNDKIGLVDVRTGDFKNW